MGAPSKRYHDYVIKDGQLVADFEAMYQNAADVPWHQDKTAYEVMAEIDLAILRHFSQMNRWRRVLDVGCGLGYFTARLAAALPGLDVGGVDISATAIAAAREQHAGIPFEVADLRVTDAPAIGTYDLVVVRDLLWYVLPQLPVVVGNLRSLLNDCGCVYISQSVPNLSEFYGKETFPDPTSILDYFGNTFAMQYASSTYEKRVKRVAGVYDMDKYARFLGQMPAAD